jgi:GT2 family glycosyltransferase
MADELPVYVVHWNAPGWARATTDSILRSTIPVRVTLIDNGPPGVPLALDERVRVTESGANLGYAGGANVGIAQWLAGDDEFCVVACHDVRLDPDALEHIVDTARANPEYGILAPEPVANVVSGPVVATSPDITDVGWASGTCLLLRRKCVDQIGPFDATFGSYGEDQDLCLRARVAGWKVGLVVGAPVRGEGSVDPTFRTQMYVNQVRLRLKHAGIGPAVKMIVAFPLLAVADASRWLVTRDRTLLRRSSSRLRAVPAAMGLVWQRVRANARRSRVDA